ncbi:MAG: endo-1,4-beta-xylanase [Kovacikia sp.]
MTRRQMLRLGIGGCIGASVLPLGKFGYHKYQVHQLGSQSRNFQVTGDRALVERAAVKGVIYGAATQQQFLAADPAFAKNFLKECRMIVTENDLQWNQVHPTPEQFDFAAADALLNFAKTNGLLFRGHNLVWHHSLPRWYREKVNAQNAEEYLIKHIQTLVRRYAGQVHSWDVVNEAINPKSGRSDQLRQTPWLEFLGPSYIETAFILAAEADPQALLVYNDFEMDYDRPEDEAKRTAVLGLLERLKSRDVPVHALGLQAHLWGAETRFNAKILSNFLRSVADLGLKILVTELDVTDKVLPADQALRDRIIASAYEDYLNVVLDEPAVIAVLTWGLSDKYTWLSEFSPRSDKLPVRPLPLDTSFKRKLTWNAIARAFDNAPIRSNSHLR